MFEKVGKYPVNIACMLIFGEQNRSAIFQKNSEYINV